MKSKKVVIIASCLCLCTALLVAVVFLFQQMATGIGNSGENDLRQEIPHNLATATISNVKEGFALEMQDLMDGKYKNLISIEFDGSIEAVKGVYRLEILRDTSMDDNTFLENFEIMEESIDKFFGEDFDKSFIDAEIYVSEKETVTVKYDDIREMVDSGMLDHAIGSGYLFGNNTSEGGNMVQVFNGLSHVWYSKYGLGCIETSSMEEYKDVYSYISCIRQGDTMLQLRDGEIALAELERIALDYMNGDSFPLIKTEGIEYGIGDARIIETEEYEGVCFMIRRIYKGVPFEYGSSFATNDYIDTLPHDHGEIAYVERTSPDTLKGFVVASGTVVEKEKIERMLTAGDALAILSEEIGGNSIYEVRGVELIYRNCEVPEEYDGEVSAILAPKWKITTINQNDDKYTLFYVDIVTGEITERFEYYYD